MDLGNVSFAEPKCWPENDIYFQAGVSFLQERLNADGNRREYSFLHLNGYTFRHFLSDFPPDKDGSIVIISSPRFLPLAHFWMANHHNVIAVFDSKTNIETLVKMLKKRPSKKRYNTVNKHAPKITDRDIIILRHYLNTGNMDYIQRRYSRSYSTVQQWKKIIASKLSIRKLELLFLQS
ncbi:hypothetical protein DMV33_23885 [Salmonella enterica subsp. enterica serovar Montevideo]|nr:hypothetical protein [Salmonella enterica subsp. enterica serovar Montevideo]EBT4809555.1 hypothetical protein [Salmonella enterica]EBX1258544.1 hypothetical protein [Salmonella enterica subsp. enterica serovar Montevideo]EDH6439982.1 hypothetical protein [Salmonella enterica subsp. enterica serovar Brandenburg]EKS2202300.1 hypothetical protein [Salmonella enterica]